METEGIDYMCPICKDYLLQPRIYECGHTICERCMINCDKSVKSEVRSTFDTPIYKCPLCRKKNWNNNIILENSVLFENENYNIIMPETIITININSDQIRINNNINSNNDDEDYNIYNDFYNTFKKIIKIILDIIIIFTVGIIFVNMFYTCELFCLLDKFLIFLAFLSGIIIVGFIYSILNCFKYNNSNE